jgi:hypothetical protein
MAAGKFWTVCQRFFSEGKHGRKVEIAEFKDLTYQDKLELRDGLIAEGYEVEPLLAPKNVPSI